MTCCHRCVTSTQFNSAVARRDLLRFRRHGRDALTRRLLAAFTTHPLPPQPTLLDIGGGIGTIHHVLLEQGFSHATHIDVSDAFLAAAEDEATRIGHAMFLRSAIRDNVGSSTCLSLPETSHDSFWKQRRGLRTSPRPDERDS